MMFCNILAKKITCTLRIYLKWVKEMEAIIKKIEINGNSIFLRDIMKIVNQLIDLNTGCLIFLTVQLEK